MSDGCWQGAGPELGLSRSVKSVRSPGANPASLRRSWAAFCFEAAPPPPQQRGRAAGLGPEVKRGPGCPLLFHLQSICKPPICFGRGKAFLQSCFLSCVGGWLEGRSPPVAGVGRGAQDSLGGRNIIPTQGGHGAGGVGRRERPGLQASVSTVDQGVEWLEEESSVLSLPGFFHLSIDALLKNTQPPLLGSKVPGLLAARI